MPGQHAFQKREEQCWNGWENCAFAFAFSFAFCLLPLPLPNVAENCWFVAQKSTSKEGLGQCRYVLDLCKVYYTRHSQTK